jgi:hypothetical protein
VDLLDEPEPEAEADVLDLDITNDRNPALSGVSARGEEEMLIEEDDAR